MANGMRLTHLFMAIGIAALISGCPEETGGGGGGTGGGGAEVVDDTKGGGDAGPTTGDTGDATATTDGDGTGGGEEVIDNDTPPPPTPPTCAEYCEAVQDACTADNVQYASEAECMAWCGTVATLPIGERGDTDGNTVGCRLYHAGVAALEDPEIHCAHAGPYGGDTCGSLCDNFCHLSQSICTGPDAIFDNADACATACADFAMDGELTDTDGDTLQCRLYHLGVAGTNPPSTAEVHCPHAAVDGGETCVDAPHPDPTCAEYCQLVQLSCQGPEAQYADETECLAYCETYAQLPLGAATDMAGNTVGCRLYHATVAGTSDIDAATIHCPHAGPSGGGVCGSWCDNYCFLEGQNCAADNAIFETVDDCMTACGDYDETGAPGATDGDTVQCRIYHLGAAGNLDAGGPDLHCPHGAVDGGGVCVGEPPLPTCGDYCAAVVAACTGDDAQYASEAECLAYCGDWAQLPIGAAADTSGNTVGCRTYHAGVAAAGPDEAALHCPHAGPSGGDTCGSWCEVYCQLAGTNCAGGDALFADDAACATACAAYDASGEPGDVSGATVQCKIYHAGVAGTDLPDSAVQHCPHAGVDGGGVCVAPVVDVCNPISALACGETLTIATDGEGSTQVLNGYGDCQPFAADDYTAGTEVTFSFVSPDDVQVTVSEVATGTADGAFTVDVIAFEDTGSGCDFDGAACAAFGTDSVAFDAAAGQKYYVTFDSYGTGTPAELDVTVTCCTASCEGKSCGDNGCGGTCGTCADGLYCTDQGACESPPDPSADTCDKAGAIGALPWTGTGTTAFNTDSYSYGTGACPGEASGWGDGAPDQAWMLTAGAAGLYTVTLAGEFDSTLYLLTDCADADNTCLGADESSGDTETVTVQLEAGQTVYIIVDGFGFDEAGSYDLSVSAVEAGADPTCSYYCGTIQAACTGDNAQYDSAEACEAYCATYGALPLGSSDDTAGNTVGCRTYHAGVALNVDPDLHCAHAGPTGGDVCGSWCDNYCHLSQTNCTGADALYADESACATACAGLSTDGEPGDADGASVQCSIYHLGVAGNADAGGPTTHCPHGAVDGGGVCVDASQLEGANCDSPLVVGSLPYTMDGDTTSASAEVKSGCVNLFTGEGSNDHVYSYTADADMAVTATLTATSFDSAFYVTTDCSGEEATCLDHADIAGAGEVESLSWDAVAGTTYFIVVDGFGSSSNFAGTYTLSIADATPELTCGFYCAAMAQACSGSNAQYADEAECLAFCETWGAFDQGTLEDVDGNTLGCRIYHAGVAADADADLHCPHAGPSGGGVCGSWCDSYCGLVGQNCTGAEELFADDAACVSACEAYSDTGAAGDDAGDTVQCRIYHAGAPAAADAALHCPHADIDGGGVCTTLPGDTCAAPFAVGALPYTGTGDTIGAGADYENECGFGGSGAGDQVWSITVDFDGSIVVDLTPTHDSILYVFSDCAAGTCLAVDDEIGDGVAEQITFPVSSGSTYYIVVDGWGTGEGSYELVVSKGLDNSAPELTCEYLCGLLDLACTGENAQYDDTAACVDYCQTAGAFPDGDLSDTDGNTVGCRIYHAGVALSGDAELHCPHAGPTGAGVCGTWCENYCSLALQNCTGGDELYADEATCLTACDGLASDAAPGAVSGDSVQCRVYHLGAPAAGDPVTHCPHGAVDGGGVCSPPPMGDHCDNPFVVGALPWSDSKDTGDYGSDYAAEDCSLTYTGGASADTVYAYTATADGDVVVSLEADYDTILYVRTGDCMAGSCDYADDETFTDGEETLTIAATSGTTYYVIVDGWGSFSNINGGYTISFVEPPAAELTCASYCATIQAACTDNDAQFADESACLAYCETEGAYPAGSLEDVSGNTLGCRLYHAGVAMTTDPGLHCPHAGPSGGDTCGTWCENLCHLTQSNCTGANELYADNAACMTACADLPTDGEAGDVDGGSVQCRIYHAGAPAAGDAATHCPHAAVDGGGVCVTVIPPGDTCEDPFVIDALPYSHTADTDALSDDYSNGGCGDTGEHGGGAPDAVYALTAPETGDYTFTFSDTGPAQLYAVWANGCVDIAANCVDGSGDILFGGDLTLSLTAGDEILIIADGWFGSDSGQYTLDVAGPSADPELTCGFYCAAIQAACTDGNAQFVDEQACLDYCETQGAYPAGALEDTSGNTLGCRIYHAGAAAAGEADLHCPHAGPSGGDVCGTWCENLCHLSQLNCTGADELYADNATCMTACGGLATDGNAGDVDGDSVQCRIYHAGAPASGDAATHCPHVAVDGGGVCVDVIVAGDTCGDAIVVDSLPYTHDGDTTDASSDYDSGDCGLFFDGSASSDVVYAYTPDADGDFTVVLNATHDSLLYVHSGTCGAGTCEGSADEIGGSQTETAIIAGTAGTTYYIFVDGYDDTTNEVGSYTLAIEGADEPEGLDIGDWTLDQDAGDKSFTFPTDTIVQTGDYVIVARNVTQEEFETFFEVTLGANVHFFSGSNSFPVVNGNDVYVLEDADANPIDGPTLKTFSGTNYQRLLKSDPLSWKIEDFSIAVATPGAGEFPSPNGIYISEISDATGTGNFKYEFVELYVSGDPAGAPQGDVLFNRVWPIYQQRCKTCHTAGASGGHSIGNANLNTAFTDSQKPAYSVSGSKGAATLARIQAGTMPQGKGCSGDPATDYGAGMSENDAKWCLTADEQALIQQWLDDGEPGPPAP